MKKITALVVLTLLIGAGVFALKDKVWGQTGNQVQTPQTATATTGTTPTTQSAANQQVTLDYVGSVRAISQIKLLPATTGQIIQTMVNEGDIVKQNDILFVIGGTNGSKPVIKSQYEIAQTNYKNAQKAVNAVKAGNDAALKAAQLGVESAQHQAQASGIDLNTFNRNIYTAQNGLSILQSTLDATRNNNQANITKAQMAINTLNDTHQNLLNSGTSADDQKIKDLDTQIATAQISLENAKAGAQIAENQILGQITTAQGQIDIQAMTRDSLGNKLGYAGNSTTDAVKMAQEGIDATNAKNSAALLQAQAQLQLAQIGLDMAKNQQEALTIRAPISGIVNQITAHVGDTVTSAAPVAQITNEKGFELVIGVNPDYAEKIDQSTKAEFKIGGRYMEVPIKNVSAVADPTTKLINVTLALPNIFFHANATLEARLIFAPGVIGN